jgi:UDP-GlcNAc3NAcA epimerase
MKIVTIVGARPQFIKAAVVSRALRNYAEVNEVMIHTGQHYDNNMSSVFFKEMEIQEPNYHLGIGSGTHGVQTGKMLEAIEQVLLSEKPDWALVYGDTNSTLAGAIAAAKLHIPVAHVEAGLRSFNRYMPEEVNRVLTDHSSSLLFTPTQTALENLRREGIPTERIHLVGDVMYDAALFYRVKAVATSVILDNLGLKPDEFILATVHRAENTDDPVRLNSIISALEKISKETPVILPLHPRTRKAIEHNKLMLSSIIRIDPTGYFDMLSLLDGCQAVFTDSGGLQKEAYFFGKPCITLRDETEWMELVENGFNVLAGADYENILQAEKSVKKHSTDFNIKLYGDPDAGESIVKILVEKANNSRIS